MTNEEIQPTEKDREKARLVVRLNFAKLCASYGYEFTDTDTADFESEMAQALADEREAQREADAKVCDAEKERLELMHDPENGVNVWELIEVADELASAIRTEAQP